jgi:hypothetical protein
MKLTALLGLALVPVLAQADEVFLRGGGHLTGQIIERGTDSIVLDVGAGEIGFPLAAVERIVPGTTPLALFRERGARLAPGDAKGWLLLALWAQEQDLPAQARSAFAHVLALDPGSAAAHRGLGHVQLAGRWMTEEESYRAQGYVRYEGSWVTPEELKAVLAERAAAAEAEARVMEAEAEARAVEAEARRAEAESRSAEAAATLPYGPYGWGSGFVPSYGAVFPSRFHRRSGLRSPFGFRPPFRTSPARSPRFVRPLAFPRGAHAAPSVVAVKARSSARVAGWR